MGMPTRFSLDYPTRCLQLIESFEQRARDQRLVGSFSILAGSSVLNVPFERADAQHFLRRESDDDLTAAMRELRKVKFSQAPFWHGREPEGWRQSHLVENFNAPDQWIGGDGANPFADGAENVIGKKTAHEVLRVLRNATAHGNIVYLDKDGREREGTEVHYLAFLSRYEETREQQEKSETYRMVATTEDEFLRFVKGWAMWLRDLNVTGEVVAA